MLQNLSSAAVVIGALRVKNGLLRVFDKDPNLNSSHIVSRRMSFLPVFIYFYTEPHL